MPAIQFGGLASNLDTKGIITALMAAERLPLIRLQRQQATVTARGAAWSSLGTSLTDLLAKLQAFTVTGAGNLRTATYADIGKLTVTADTSAVTGQYQVRVDQLATASSATSTGAIGTAITDATATGTLAALPLAGAASAGQVGIVVDGTILAVTVGDPTTTSLSSVMAAMASAIQAKIRTTDGAATVTASIVGNKATFSVSGAAANHALSFGVASDTSNLLTLAGLSGSSTSTFGLGSPTLTGSTLLGVVRTTSSLDTAGLTGLTSTASGVLTINGSAIAYDSTVDTLATVLSRINNSAAGVIASVDRVNDRVVFTRKTAGPLALAIQDTSGTLAAALKLAPGTTGAQIVGLSSKVTVNGTTTTSDTNRVSTAIAGVTLDLLATNVTASTLTVGVDAVAIQNSLQAIVTSYNALADKLDTLAAHTAGGPTGALESRANVASLALGLRTSLMAISGSFSGSIRSLADIGVSSGAVGAKVGSTTRLSLDPTKLNNALTVDATTVGRLLNSVQGVLAPVVDRLKALTGGDGAVRAGTDGATAELAMLSSAAARLQARLDVRQASLERKFAALEATLARSQVVAGAVAAQVARS